MCGTVCGVGRPGLDFARRAANRVADFTRLQADR